MNVVEIINPIIAISSLGLVFGIGLGIASKKFAVEKDERVEQIKETLPGANCGGCGFAGCEAFAKEVVAGTAKINGCSVCNSSQIEKIAEIMGQVADTEDKKIAYIKCKGTSTAAKEKYIYDGVESCLDAHLIGGGPKGCPHGCLGLGTCVAKCSFGALSLKEGLPVVDPDKCTGCGACAQKCPRNVIAMIDAKAPVQVACNSNQKGKEVKSVCAVGCIGCGICVKQCENDAIKLENNVAIIDAKKCINCGKCTEKCPVKIIELR
ncbi:MAG: RnfABCDGE type electron transport complex subunit B [Cellulosilyticaceae bacterium]